MAAQQNLLISFYGDDFTGSTDSMEALTTSGVKTILFLEVPDQRLLQERFPDIQAFGVAGLSRTMSPVEMEEELKPVLKKLHSFGAPLVHYKICSTFDSSPEIGSIGKVMDICAELSPSQGAIPLLVGCPLLKRYTVFGNHFATVEAETYRLDRHPTMSKHPTTPMNEADLRNHLSQQTDKRTSLLSVLDLEKDEEQLKAAYSQKAMSGEGILFDVLQDHHLAKIGKLLWEQRGQTSPFVIGSSGVEYALTEYWRNQPEIGSDATPDFTTSSVENLLVVSGSCSPVTREQIEWALTNGFIGIQIQTEELVHPLKQEQAFTETFHQASQLLLKGKSVVIYTSFGPDDPSIAQTKDILVSLGENPANTGKIIGKQLGKLTKEILQYTGLKRAVIAGGDTSGYATKELGVYGLEMMMPIAPGGPLCRCYSEDEQFDGLELSLKGGQVGKADYFGVVQAGNRAIFITEL